MVLGYFEMPEEDRPEENIWHHSEELEQHFEMVAARHRNPGAEPVEDPDDPPGSKYVANELYERYLKEAQRR